MAPFLSRTQSTQHTSRKGGRRPDGDQNNGRDGEPVGREGGGRAFGARGPGVPLQPAGEGPRGGQLRWGNTSTKARERDHTGREVDVLWVKGSGSDLATIEAGQFTGLKLDEVLALEEREQMSDEEMVAYLASCQLAPDMPRGSIETLLHAFVPYAQVDHTHPDAVNMICCSEGGEELARECFGDEAVWIPYIRPGFILSKQVGEAVRNNPDAKFVLLAKHGLVTWGNTHEESYGRTIEAINRAAEFVASRAGEPF